MYFFCIQRELTPKMAGKLYKLFKNMPPNIHNRHARNSHDAKQEIKNVNNFFSGESYLDCCERILNTLVCLETPQDQTFLVVAHQGLLRCVLGYLLRVPIDEIPYISVPQHAILRAVWSNGRYHVEYIRLPVDEAS